MLQFVFSFLVSCLFSALFLIIALPFFNEHFAQPLKESGPTWHSTKKGTPTLGGIAFIFSMTIVSLILSRFTFNRDNLLLFLVLLVFCFLFGLVGFLDDYVKIVKKNNKGITPTIKIIAQTIVATSFIVVCKLLNIIDNNVFFKIINKSVDFGFVYYIVMIIFIVGIVNSVNITDGVDGLAGSVSSIVLLQYFIMSLINKNHAISIISSSTLGGVVGFLFFNLHPAKIFMGDTGSQFLGGTIAILAILSGSPFALLLIGVVFIIEVLSDIIQLSYKRIKHKKLFKMAPFHHHLELSGWNENKIVIVSTLITVFFSIVVNLIGGLY